MELNQESKSIIQKLCDRQGEQVEEKEKVLIKKVEDSIVYFKNQTFSSLALYNLITSLTLAQSDLAKLEGERKSIEYFENMKECTF